MKKFFIIVLFVSFLTVGFTIFIYSPHFSENKKVVIQAINKFFTYKKGEVRFDSGLTPSFSVTPTPIVTPVAKIAIVLDDFGYDRESIKQLISLSLPINPSIIPFLPESEYILKEAKANGLDPLLHLPMEPENRFLNPGKGAIYVRFSDDEIRKRTEKAIKSLTGIIGVNNHMGSLATSSERVMKDVIDVLKQYNLFFLDSLTSSSSVAYKVAEKSGLLPLKRDIFLDNYKDEEYIKGQLEKLVNIALKKGFAIGIGHANNITISTISEFMPIFKQKNIAIISLKEYVDKRMANGKN